MKRLKLEDIEREDIVRYQIEFWTTNNRGVFKLRYHHHLGKTAQIRCDYCLPGRGCNVTRRRESYFIDIDKKCNRIFFKKRRSRFPNWKLVSKNKKQWMKKPLKFIEGRYRIEIEW